MKDKTTTRLHRLLGVGLSILMMLLMLLPARTAAQATSGTGWSLVGKILYIQGNDATSLQDNPETLLQVEMVVIMNDVTGIGSNTFKGCVNLTTIEWGNNTQTIGSNAFEGCTSLEQALLPATLKQLGQYAFKGCTKLDLAQLNEGLESIGASAFDGCVELKILMLPASVKSLNSDNVTYIEAFRGSSIKSLAVALDNPYFAEDQSVLFNKDKTTLLYYPENVVVNEGQYTVPEGVTKIQDQAFFSNLTLEEVILPAYVTTLGSNIFKSARKLKKATIQGDVSSMAGMFSDCPLLETVAIESKTPPADFADGTFSNCPALTSIVVDGRSVETYKSKLPDPALKALVTGSYTYSDLDLSAFQSGSNLFLSYTETDGWMYATSNYPGTPTTPFTGTLTGVFNGTGIQIDETPQGIIPPVLTLREATVNAKFNTTINASFTLLVSGAGGSRIVTENPEVSAAFSSSGTLTIRAEQPLTIEGYNSGLFNSSALTLDGDITVKGGFWNITQGTITPGPTPNVRFMAVGTEKFNNEGTAPELLTLLFDVAPEAGRTVWVYEDVTPVVSLDFAADGTSKAYALFAPQGKFYRAWMDETRLQNAATDLFEGGKTHDINSMSDITVTITTQDEEVTISRPNTTIKGDGHTAAGNITLETADVFFDKVVTDKLTIDSGVDFTLTEEIAKELTVTGIYVNNNGTFTDQTGTVTKVVDNSGTPILCYNPPTPIAEIPANASAVNIQIVIPEGNALVLTLQKNDAVGVWQNVPQSKAAAQGLRSTTSTVTISAAGTYRVGITVGTTTLFTKPITVTKAVAPDPEPDPVYYNVSLPVVEGATLDPSAGDHAVEEWTSFRFYLTLDADYNQSQPVVTTSRGETLEPRSSDGAYIVRYVSTDLTISISGIVKNASPVGNEELQAGVTVSARDGVIRISTSGPEDVQIVRFNGQLVKSFRVSSGNVQIPLSEGAYIVKVGGKTFKVIL